MALNHAGLLLHHYFASVLDQLSFQALLNNLVYS